ncbi:MAG: hypothetical protein H7039_18485 [Bryobacteraceae bacterium]|nr:hypothetical protein [Bryobacteraceae bacterium]
MRYWGILVAKLAAAVAILLGIYRALEALYTPPDHIIRWKQQPFLHDLGWTTIMFALNLLFFGLLFLVVWDQRRRCRTCGRVLRMPVSHGRYGQMLLFGRPRTEYICIYGHGTLTQPELHIGVREPSDWKSHDAENIWDELYALDEKGPDKSSKN